MTELALVTVATASHVPDAQVLTGSFLEHHPHARAAVLLVDDADQRLAASLDPRVEVLRPADLALEPGEIDELWMLHDAFELSMALKPLAILTMLDRGAGRVLYLDGDIEVLGPLDDLVSLADRSGIALTPHRFDPVPDDGALPTEEVLARSGTFNAGFVAATPAGRPLLEAWWAALRHECVIDNDRGQFLDQRWLDRAPALHDVAVVRDPGCNVGYWNVDTRPITRGGPTGWLAGEHPLRLFHFSGFDPLRPWLLSTHVGGAPRVPLSQQPALVDLCRDHARRLLDAGWAAGRRRPYRWSRLPDGTRIDARMRRVYRHALRAAIEGRSPQPPNPFRPGELAAFWQLLQEPHPDHPRVSRYQYEVWVERADVAAVIGHLQRDAADRFAEWLLEHGARELHIPPRLLPEAPALTRFRQAAAGPPDRDTGLAVAGLVGADLGVGQAARLAIAAARAAGLDPEVIGYDNTRSPTTPLAGTVPAAEARADVALVCLNPDVLPNFVDTTWPRFHQGRRVVGLWFWEVDVVTDQIRRAFDLVDEVWVTTGHVHDALAPVATVPVELVDLPLVLGEAPALEDPRPRLGLPDDRFTFLFSYDTFSVPERKNPLGVLEAFCRAFSPDEGPLLVIKTINAAGDTTIEHIRHLARHRPDVVVIDRYLSAAELQGLTAAAGCYVSLHRAEGWGLTLAEAMALGTPVIATGWSGNTSFMDEHNSFLVPYHLVSVGPGSAPYPPEAVWAQPDLDAAAAAMRHVWEQPDAARKVAERARQDILERHTPSATARAVAEAVERARARRHGST